MTGKIVLIPKISPEDFPLDLPSPTAANCGGYIIPSNTTSKISYAYSPIDLCVAGVEALDRDLIITDLNRFFYLYNSSILSVHKLYLGILDENDVLHIESIAYWRAAKFDGLYATLQKNAPFTFRK